MATTPNAQTYHFAQLTTPTLSVHYPVLAPEMAEMANPRPTPKPLIFGPPWPPGTRGNPAGYSRGRRISDAIDRLTEEMALNREFGSTAKRLECRQRSYVQ